MEQLDIRIQEALTRNMEIDPLSVCTHPLAICDFPASEEITYYARYDGIRKKDSESRDRQMEDYRDKNIIHEVQYSKTNFPQVMVPKTDHNGKPTGEGRLCVKMRHLQTNLYRTRIQKNIN